VDPFEEFAQYCRLRLAGDPHLWATTLFDELTLHAADLLDEGSFTGAMQGCELVVHTASPFLLGKVKDPEARLVRARKPTSPD
jgi:hypothetical protein